jgi:hypothetical protein
LANAHHRRRSDASLVALDEDIFCEVLKECERDLFPFHRSPKKVQPFFSEKIWLAEDPKKTREVKKKSGKAS